MPGPHGYKHLTPDQLRELHQGWFGTLNEWFDFTGQHGTNRRARRGLRHCLREIRRIEAVARRRIRL